MNLKSISIFMPRDNHFYQSILKELIKSFKDSGVNAYGKCELLNEQDHLVWLHNHPSDAVFEMNRVGSEVPWLPKNIKHISWIVDFGGRDHTQIHGSDISYFFCPNSFHRYKADNFSDWLPPGASQAYCSPSKPTNKNDFVFIGHIPEPWTESELNFSLGNNGDYKFSHLLNEYKSTLIKDLRSGTANWFEKSPSHKDLKNLVYSILRKRTGNTKLPRKIEYDILERTKRVDSRQLLIDSATEHGSNDLIIFGSESWKSWDKYKKFYRKYLSTSEELKQAYTSSKFCLHEGVGMHFRSMDCMAAGGVILFSNQHIYRKIPNLGSGLHTYFEHKKHYLQYDNEEELFNAYNEFSNDSRKLNQIRENASNAIRRSHLWHHRAQKIINDYSNNI